MWIDQKKIEETAVHKVESVFDKIPNILTHFSINDKGICIDGGIEIYSENSFSKDSFAGSIPVQIKGTRSKPSSDINPKIRVNVKDLKHYRDVYGGVLYIYVFLDSHLNTVGIFYKEYLPFDINELLKNIKSANQKTISDRFNLLPFESLQLKRLCFEFLDNKKMQIGSNGVSYLSSMGKDLTKLEFDHYSFSKTFFVGEDILSYKPFSTGVYVYGVTTEGLKFPVEKIDSIVGVNYSSVLPISSGDNSLIMKVDFEDIESSKIITFGGFKLVAGNPGKITFTSTGGFYSRLAEAKLMKSIFLTRELHIGALTISKFDYDFSSIESIDGLIVTYQKYVDLLKCLHITTDCFDPNELTNQDFLKLDKLYKGLICCEDVHLNGIEDDVVNLNVDVQGKRIKILAKQNLDKTYKLYDLLHGDFWAGYKTASIDGDDVYVPLPSLCILNREDLRLAININSDHFEETLNRLSIEKEAHADSVLLLNLLDMLQAYDEGAFYDKELLKCCDALSKKLLDINNGSSIYLINRLQVIYRMRNLNDEELNMAKCLVVNDPDLKVKISALILLKQFEDVNLFFPQLADEEKSLFRSWPIFNLME